jgi:hypothetical protein
MKKGVSSLGESNLSATDRTQADTPAMLGHRTASGASETSGELQ